MGRRTDDQAGGVAPETPSAPLYPEAWNVHQYETFAGIDRNYSRWSRQEMTGFFS